MPRSVQRYTSANLSGDYRAAPLESAAAINVVRNPRSSYRASLQMSRDAGHCEPHPYRGNLAIATLMANVIGPHRCLGEDKAVFEGLFPPL